MKKFATLVVGVGLCASLAHGQTYRKVQEVVASGAVDASNTSYRMRGTIGQAIIGTVTSSTGTDYQGFWHFPVPNTGIEIHQVGLPGDWQLFQNYPNPFNPSTNIKFSLPSEAKVILRVISMTGAVVKTLVDEHYAAGEYSVVFDANEFPTGTYLYTLEAGGHLMTKRMILIK